jgi:hypothetical protein
MNLKRNAEYIPVGASSALRGAAAGGGGVADLEAMGVDEITSRQPHPGDYYAPNSKVEQRQQSRDLAEATAALNIGGGAANRAVLMANSIDKEISAAPHKCNNPPPPLPSHTPLSRRRRIS